MTLLSLESRYRKHRDRPECRDSCTPVSIYLTEKKSVCIFWDYHIRYLQEMSQGGVLVRHFISLPRPRGSPLAREPLVLPLPLVVLEPRVKRAVFDF